MQKEELEKKKLRAPLKARRQSKARTIEPPISPSDEQEASFWNTPGAAARTLHFTGESLMDEEVDLANVSTASFGTPVVPHKDHRLGSEGPQASLHLAAEDDAEEEDEVDDVLADADDMTEPTVVVAATLSVPPVETAVAESEESISVLSPLSPTPIREAEPASVTPHNRQKIRVTTELERIVVWSFPSMQLVTVHLTSTQEKIWATVGEIIMPGHPFDALGKSTNKSKPPRAKETMFVLFVMYTTIALMSSTRSYLRELSSHTPTPSSPSTSSFSSLAAPSSANTSPTAQQVLTAHMLLALLGAPSHSLTLRALKESLSAKAVSVGTDTSAALLGGSAVTKPLYGCVAKRLLKIERGAGEQIVKFDS